MNLIAFDNASRRHMDENGFLHVSLCHISKEQVVEYYGSEIPGWQEHGLEADRVYRGYRPGDELARAAKTFNGLPLLSEHQKDSAEDPLKNLRIGNLGTDAEYKAPYLNNSLIIQDAEAIEALNPADGSSPIRELSASYRYDPVFTSGKFQGEAYDFIMTNIRGNHVAIVDEGRAGPDVIVSDKKPFNSRGWTMDLKALLEQLLGALGSGTADDGEGPDNENKTAMDNQNPDASTGKKDEGTASDSDDFADRLGAYLATMEDKELSGKLAEIVEAVKASAMTSDEDPEAGKAAEDQDPENAEEGKEKPAEDEDPDEKDKEKDTAMDSRRKPGKVGKSSKDNARIAMDAANAIYSKVRSSLKSQIDAAREVRPLVGELDPMAFDSAASIYRKALELSGRPTKVTDVHALKEMCSMACDSKRGKAYPVVSTLLAGDSKGDMDPAFANIGNIRKA